MATHLRSLINPKMGASSSKPKHELRSCRVAYQEHLQTGTTTTRKEKAIAKESGKQNNGNGQQISKTKNPWTNKTTGLELKDKRFVSLTAATKDVDSVSNWSETTLCDEGKQCRK